MKHKPDNNTLKLKQWIAKRPSANLKRLRKLMNEGGYLEYGVTHALHAAQCSALRRDLVKTLSK